MDVDFEKTYDLLEFFVVDARVMVSHLIKAAQLDAILSVKSHLDHSVGVRYSCRQASCGSCGMKINGNTTILKGVLQHVKQLLF